MLFLVLVIYLFQYDTWAMSVPTDMRAPVSDGKQTTGPQRTMFSIIWGCTSTIIICTWVSVHPNVPPRNKRRALLRRVKMMIWTIIAPELVLAWAVRQWFAARIVENRHKGHGWTTSHGHFVVMGGLTLVHDGVNEPREPQWTWASFALDVRRKHKDLTYKNYEKTRRDYEKGKGIYEKLKEEFEEQKRCYEESQRSEKERRQYEGEREIFEQHRRHYEVVQRSYRRYSGDKGELSVYELWRYVDRRREEEEPEEVRRYVGPTRRRKEIRPTLAELPSWRLMLSIEDEKRYREERNRREAKRWSEGQKWYKEEKQRFDEEERQYEDERERYEEERRCYEAERVQSQEQRGVEVVDQQDEERIQYEKTRLSFKEKLRHYKRRRREYEAQCRHYRLGSLTLDHFSELVRESKIDFPVITPEEIKDRSKADVLTKTLVVLQTTWFMIQCAARAAQGLALTELELATLALASLNAITYAFWWNKPLGVQEPVKIYLKKTEKTPAIVPVTDEEESLTVAGVAAQIGARIEELMGEVADDVHTPCRYAVCCSTASFHCNILDVPRLLFLAVSVICLSPFPLAIAFLLRVLDTEPDAEAEDQSPENRRLIATQIISSLRSILYILTSSTRNFFKPRFDTALESRLSYFILAMYIVFPSLLVLLLLVLLSLAPFFTLFFLIYFLFSSVFGIVTTSAIRPGAMQVPAFYAPKTDSDRYSRMLVFALFGAIFGGLHCIGWHFEYPTVFEQTLWRVTALTITCIPLIVAPVDFILTNVKESPDHWRKNLSFSALDLFRIILLFTYVLARLLLLAQALVLLRHQPQSAFVSINWTRYLPHILGS